MKLCVFVTKKQMFDKETFPHHLFVDVGLRFGFQN